jgi:hypothetical protein
VRVLPTGPFAARATLRLRPEDGQTGPRAVWWFAKPIKSTGGGEHLEVFQEAPAEPA